MFCYVSRYSIQRAGFELPYPDLYDVTYSYTGFQQSQGDNSFPGTQLDADLAGLEDAIEGLSDFVKLAIRADGALINGIVTVDALSAPVKAMIGDADVLEQLEEDMSQIAADKAATAADRVQTGLDKTATAADRVQTGLDKTATAADRVQTGLDKTATAADRVQTGLDRVATTADAATATAQRVLAQAAATAAASSLDTFDDRMLGSKAADPTVDNDGNALLDGAMYWNTTTGLKIYKLSTTTWNAYSAAVGIGNVVEDTTPQLGGNLDLNTFGITGFGNWKVVYSSAAGVLTQLSLGADATIFASNGAAVAPTFRTLDSLGAAVKAGNQNLTGGFTATSGADGTKTTGTYTPDPLTGNFKHITANGAFTLAPPAAECTLIVEVLNGASAGAITTSGFTKVNGDTYATTNALKYAFHILKTKNYSRLYIEALQ